MNARGFHLLAIGLAMMAAQAVAPAQAQVEASVSIAAVVNDEVVTEYDIDQRLRLLMTTSDITDTPEARKRYRPQVLRSLIEEKVQSQEAARLQVGVSDPEVDDVVKGLADRNGISSETLYLMLDRNGVIKQSLRQQILAQLKWKKVVRQRLLGQIQVSDDEVQRVLARQLSSAGDVESQVIELVLAVDDPTQEAEARQKGERILEQVRGGSKLAALAQQFSQSPSSVNGGDLGWVLKNQLPPEVDTALAALKPGEVSGLVRTGRGYYIVELRERRQAGALDLDLVQIDLRQVLFPVTAALTEADIADRTRRAAAERERLGNCETFEASAAKIDWGTASNVGRIRVSALPEVLRAPILAMAVGEISQPVRSEAGIHLFMVCDRKDPESRLPTAETVRYELSNDKLALKARRYLRDLQSEAFVEIR